MGALAVVPKAEPVQRPCSPPATSFSRQAGALCRERYAERGSRAARQGIKIPPVQQHAGPGFNWMAQRRCGAVRVVWQTVTCYIGQFGVLIFLALAIALNLVSAAARTA